MVTGRCAPLLALALMASLTAARCGDSDAVAYSDGLVADEVVTYEALDYELTSDRYTRWLRAQEALDSVGLEDRARIDVRDVDDDDVDRVVRSLEEQPRARQAIESADISVRDFVLTTVALAQSWDAVNRPGTTRVTGARPENLEFLRRQSADDPRVRERPDEAFIDDGDSDRDSDSERGKGKKEKKNRGRGVGRRH